LIVPEQVEIVRTEQVVRAADGREVFRRRWAPKGAAIGSVVLVHGIGEHSGRYDNVGEHLARAGYEVCGCDLRGHGRSGGKRGHTRFREVHADLDQLFSEVHERAMGKPVFLYGHSLGGLISLAYALDRRPAIAGLVLSGPAIHTFVAREQPLKMFIARHLGRVLPAVTVASRLDPMKLTRDEVELAEYLADPLVHKRASMGLGRDVQLAAEQVLARASTLGVRLLIIHGGDDQINYLSGSQAVAAKLGDRCRLHVYEGMLHKPHKDPDSKRVLGDVVAWFEECRSKPTE
jgi:alpha-beta hydrolase superfamily lysophospholipase